MSNLTIRQERFAEKYVELGNASEAYRQSYDAADMAPETVYNEASLLLRNHEGSARISPLYKLAKKRHEVTVDRISAEYSKLGCQDIRKAFNEDGSMKPIQELDSDTAAAIAEFEVEEAYMGTSEGRRVIARIKKVKLSERRGS